MFGCEKLLIVIFVLLINISHSFYLSNLVCQQSWCPVCRTSISIGPDVANSTKTEAKAKKDGQAHETDSPKVNRNLFLVANAEDEYEDSSECKEG